MIRLVKGAYWDTEVKRAQVRRARRAFPVYTRQGRDRCQLPVLRCAICWASTDRIYPQFATHNAHTVAAILEMAKAGGTTPTGL